MWSTQQAMTRIQTPLQSITKEESLGRDLGCKVLVHDSGFIWLFMSCVTLLRLHKLGTSDAAKALANALTVL